MDHLDDARRLGRSVNIRRPELCTIARWEHDASMQHAGRPHVLHIARAARDLGRDVDPMPHVRQEMMHHLRIREDVERGGVAVPASFGQGQRLRWRHGEGLATWRREPAEPGRIECVLLHTS